MDRDRSHGVVKLVALPDSSRQKRRIVAVRLCDLFQIFKLFGQEHGANLIPIKPSFLGGHDGADKGGPGKAQSVSADHGHGHVYGRLGGNRLVQMSSEHEASEEDYWNKKEKL